jgi:hypothetical protein
MRVPDPAYHFDADPVQRITLMQIRIRILPFNLTRIRIHNTDYKTVEITVFRKILDPEPYIWALTTQIRIRILEPPPPKKKHTDSTDSGRQHGEQKL